MKQLQIGMFICTGGDMGVDGIATVEFVPGDLIAKVSPEINTLLREGACAHGTDGLVMLEYFKVPKKKRRIEVVAITYSDAEQSHRVRNTIGNAG